MNFRVNNLTWLFDGHRYCMDLNGEALFHKVKIRQQLGPDISRMVPSWVVHRELVEWLNQLPTGFMGRTMWKMVLPHEKSSASIGRMVFRIVTEPGILMFSRKKDAIMFKLAWHGRITQAKESDIFMAEYHPPKVGYV